ncbi:MAG: helix-turn-helix transcriptional regulator [Eubacterium sp.]|jgi:DNA-binding Xre family transcriptional regulator|nr:helix-turn-helix transcriptional regulator [Eubacterium sp.]
MGDGKKLKKILDAQQKSVRWLSKETTISPTTLYSIIQKDTAIRFDFALRIANVLNVEVSDICSDSALQAEDWSDESRITLPELPHGFDKVLDENRIKTYLKNSLYPLMEMFGKNNLPKLDEHLTNYYQLTDEGRRDVDQFINAQLQIKKDPKRAKDVKTIKKW